MKLIKKLYIRKALNEVATEIRTLSSKDEAELIKRYTAATAETFKLLPLLVKVLEDKTISNAIANIINNENVVELVVSAKRSVKHLEAIL